MNSICKVCIRFLCISFLWLLSAGAIPPDDLIDESSIRFKPKIKETIVDQFSDSNISLLYRGIFFSSQFDLNAIRDFVSQDRLGSPIICSGGYDLGLSSFTIPSEVLLTEGEYISQSLNGFLKGDRFFIQQEYSNDYKKFFKSLKKKEEDIFKKIPSTSNPFISFSSELKQALRYGYGVKTYHLDTQKNIPTNLPVGILQGIIVDDKAVEDHNPVDVYTAHNNRKLKIRNHYANNILTEKEVSIAGYVDGETVFMEAPLLLPDLEREYTKDFLCSYGMTKTRYQNLQKQTDEKIQRSKLIEQLINPKEDKKENYQKTPIRKIEKIIASLKERYNLFEDEELIWENSKYGAN